MHRLLIRSGMLPTEDMPVSKMILRSRMGGNIGNLVYQYAVLRQLTAGDDYEFTADYYVPQNRRLSDKEIAAFDEKYEMYALPLADAIRPDFMTSMENTTNFVKRSKMKTAVIGMGIRADLADDPDNISFPFDSTVKEFVKAVLDKSAVVGVRGEATLRYLKRLGFKEESEVTVIGCPSLYMYGDGLKMKDPVISPDSRILVNNSSAATPEVCAFLRKVWEEYPESYYVTQAVQELKCIYMGARIDLAPPENGYPNDINDPVFQSGRAVYPLNYLGWRDFAKGAALSVGARFHGNVASILSGVPAVMIVKDMRMRELAAYHHIPCVTADRISPDTELTKLIEEVDFGEFGRYHKENYDHYVDFLEKNEIANVCSEMCAEGYVAPYDRITADIDSPAPARPVCVVDEVERNARTEEYFRMEAEYIADLKKQKSSAEKNRDKFRKESAAAKKAGQELQKENEALKAEIERLKEENRTIREEAENGRKSLFSGLFRRS
ncbi:MAG: polysaccharide pyruvyl transferase family protein [Lachnospiraceae bacterium]|nr:polysaccharide pyruvyl transferase family protein [Lachnospiraceae bacterium]